MMNKPREYRRLMMAVAILMALTVETQAAVWQWSVKVTVVAWQLGLQGKVQSATPVEQTFFITK